MTAETIREQILKTVAKNGGHLASSLGAVEIAMALYEVFDAARDRVIWDVGHQAYAWKILTGRSERFSTLRTLDGISGFPNPNESPCDAAVAGHAGVAISTAVGFAAARDRKGTDEHVVAVVGDAAIANGVSFEALNNCAAATKKVIVVLNDNEMSISRPVGSFARLLGRLITGVRYNRVKKAAERAGHAMKLTFLRGIYHGIESRIKSLFLGSRFFEQFGLRYIGPVDGHDLASLKAAFTVAKEDEHSVLVHVVTRKGKGYPPAEKHPTQWHGVGPFAYGDVPCASCLVPGASCLVPRDSCLVARGSCIVPGAEDAPSTKHEALSTKHEALSTKHQALSTISWSEAFGTALVERAKQDGRIVALTAGMTDGTGLAGFAREFPRRFFDVGIAEEHLTAFAAGLAAGGMRPVIAIYSTFLQRAVDQVMHDVCIAKLPVVFCVDRAGVVGADGATHQGVFDIAMLRCLPNLTIAQPKDAGDLAALLDEALNRDGPTVIRYPRGKVARGSWLVARDSCLVARDSCLVSGAEDALSAKHQALSTKHQALSTRHQAPSTQYAIWATGDWYEKARHVAKRVGGVAVHARYLKPFDAALLAEQRKAGMKIVALENGSVCGGLGEAIGADLKFGWPDEFIPHGSQAELERRYGLDADSIISTILHSKL